MPVELAGLFPRGAALFMMAILTASCGGNEPPRSPPVSRGDIPRHFAVARWDTVWAVDSLSDGEAFKDPYRVRVTPGGVYVGLDNETVKLVALSTSGRQRWVAGVVTKGLPIGLSNIRDMQIFDGRSLAVLYGIPRHVAEFDEQGRVVRDTPLPSEISGAAKLASIHGDTVVLVDDAQSSPIIVIVDGHIRSRVAFPWTGYAKLPLLARQTKTITTSDGRWVLAFNMASAWYLMRGTSPISRIRRYVDYHGFPKVRVDSTPRGNGENFVGFHPCVLCGAAASDSVLYLLPGATNETLGNVIDRFSLRDGAYLGSVKLPMETDSFAVEDSTYIVSVNSPRDAIVALRARRSVR